MRAAFTLLELLVTCAVFGMAAAIALPRVRAAVDAFAVQAAARETANALALGRLAALRYGGAEVRFDSASVTIRAGTRSIFTRSIAKAHGVRLRASPGLVRYAATGVGVGLSNGSIVLTRGSASDTVVVSRLGRVRY